jgi:lycopene beta-cyclase
MRPDTEIAIVGAGCAGLSLAAALGIARVPGQVCLLEPRATYQRDRTWCFWNTEDHPFAASISYSWKSWRVSSGSRQAIQSSSRYRYCHIGGDAFYRAGLDFIAAQPMQEINLGVSVHSIEPHPSGHLAVETSAGRLLARQVFDSRPPVHHALAAPALVQRFVGWHVRTTAARFKPDLVELMRFLPDDTPGRVRFLYLLPFSATEALVEMTYLDAPDLPEPAYIADLQAWLDEQDCQGEILYAEQGSLPMHLSRPVAASTSFGNRLHAIGVRGGRLKPSSGYAFLRIQRHSRAIAHALLAGRPIPATAEPPVYRAMDAIFLEALQHSHTEAPELFLRMFEGADPDQLVRFLSETSAPREMLRVAWSLPKLPMMHAVAHLAQYAADRPGAIL